MDIKDFAKNQIGFWMFNNKNNPAKRYGEVARDYRGQFKLLIPRMSKAKDNEELQFNYFIKRPNQLYKCGKKLLIKAVHELENNNTKTNCITGKTHRPKNLDECRNIQCMPIRIKTKEALMSQITRKYKAWTFRITTTSIVS